MLEVQTTAQRFQYKEDRWRLSRTGCSFGRPKSGSQKQKKSRVPIRKGLRTRIYLCILRFVGTISCERKVRVDGVRLTATMPATRVVECLGRHRISPGRPQTYTPKQVWYRGYLVQGDISRAPVQGGYQQ